MADYSELKKLAEEVNEAFPDKEDLWSMVCTPTVGLELIAEIDRLRDSHQQVCENYNKVSYASEERGKQIDQLKAENEALRKDAERYRFLRNGPDCIDLTGAESMEEIDAVIDAAMCKESSHD